MDLDFDELDHVDCLEEGIGDDEAELFVLFADALDPETPSTVDGRAAEWRELFGGPPPA